MSSTGAAHHFQRWVGQPSNVDRCDRCHLPRSAHGPDWCCPGAVPARIATVAWIAGVVLTLTGIVLRVAVGSAAQPGQAMVMGYAVLAGIILIVAGVVLGGERR